MELFFSSFNNLLGHWNQSRGWVIYVGTMWLCIKPNIVRLLCRAYLYATSVSIVDTTMRVEVRIVVVVVMVVVTIHLHSNCML